MDLSTQCPLIKLSKAQELIESWYIWNLPVLGVFGISTVPVIVKCVVELEIDSVNA